MAPSTPTILLFLGSPALIQSACQPSMPSKESPCWFVNESPRKISRRPLKHCRERNRRGFHRQNIHTYTHTHARRNKSGREMKRQKSSSSAKMIRWLCQEVKKKNLLTGLTAHPLPGTPHPRHERQGVFRERRSSQSRLIYSGQNFCSVSWLSWFRRPTACVTLCSSVSALSFGGTGGTTGGVSDPQHLSLVNDAYRRRWSDRISSRICASRSARWQAGR